MDGRSQECARSNSCLLILWLSKLNEERKAVDKQNHHLFLTCKFHGNHFFKSLKMIIECDIFGTSLDSCLTHFLTPTLGWDLCTSLLVFLRVPPPPCVVQGWKRECHMVFFTCKLPQRPSPAPPTPPPHPHPPPPTAQCLCFVCVFNIWRVAIWGL